MFLSNSRKSLLLITLAALLLHGCSSSVSNSAKSVSPSARTSDKPFPTKAPETYQGDFVVGNGTTETQYFVARDRDKWRFDIYHDNAPWMTQLRSDKVYLLDHVKKEYAPEPFADLEEYDTTYFDSLTWGFFRGANYIDFEEVGRDGNLTKYKARTLKESKSDVLITIDNSTGMMVRQEITSPKDGLTYTYEVRNLKLEGDDSVFAIPSGYTRVTHLDEIPKPSPRP